LKELYVLAKTNDPAKAAEVDEKLKSDSKDDDAIKDDQDDDQVKKGRFGGLPPSGGGDKTEFATNLDEDAAGVTAWDELGLDDSLKEFVG
jgi:hypothetical protein